MDVYANLHFYELILPSKYYNEYFVLDIYK